MKKTSRSIMMVFTTVAKRSDAVKLSRTLVRQRVAACASLVPGIRSFYWWEGKIAQGREILVMLKTTEHRYRALERAIRTSHPYSLPEILAVPVTKGYIPYLAWVSKETHD